MEFLLPILLAGFFPVAVIYLLVSHSRLKTVRRQSFWNQERPKLRESLAHLISVIMRRVVCDASAAFRASFV